MQYCIKMRVYEYFRKETTDFGTLKVCGFLFFGVER